MQIFYFAAALAAFLWESLPAAALEALPTSFEEAALEEARFGLGFSATAFHWVEEVSGLEKVARLFCPGGWWAMAWHVFGDVDRADPFHEAAVALYSTYSNIQVRPDREAVLGELGRMVREEFGGSVKRNMVTSLYLARRAGG